MDMKLATRPSRTGDSKGGDTRSYLMGYSPGEFARLEAQGAFLRDLTEDVLRRAGVGPGMRVLDLGCGVGDVSLLAAELVGASGEVVGVDRSAAAIELARRRAADTLRNRTRFAVSEIDAFATDERFDAVIGRFVLMYLPDPAATLRRLCRMLHPGGIVAFHEIVMPLARSVPEGKLYRQCFDWVLEAFARSGFEPDMGSKLFATFRDADLPAPEMIFSGRAEGGPRSFAYDHLATSLRSLLPVLERFGIATAAELDPDTLAERLRQEALESRACIVPPPLIGAWARVPT